MRTVLLDQVEPSASWRAGHVVVVLVAWLALLKLDLPEDRVTGNPVLLLKFFLAANFDFARVFDIGLINILVADDRIELEVLVGQKVLSFLRRGRFIFTNDRVLMIRLLAG